MYKIYADGKLLHAPHLVLDGCGVFSPKLVEELNKADSLDYTLPPNNELYDAVTKLKTIITVYQHNEEIFRGRVLYDEKDFYKQKRTTCEGELNFLLDSKQRPYTFSGKASALFKKLIENHNSRVESTKQFTIGNITAAKAGDEVYCDSKDYPSTLDEINAQIIDSFGGYLKVRGNGNTRYIDWLEEYGTTNTQTIEFGVNLLDITEYISAEDIYTVLIPLGASQQDEEGNDTGRLDITSVNGGKDYIENETAISLFGRIEQVIMWDEITNATALKTIGKETLDKNIEMSVTLTVKAVDLHALNVDVERIRLGDNVRVISIPHGLNRYFQCTKITHDMTNPDQTEYVFGVNYTSLTDMQASREKNIDEAVAVVQSSKNAINHSVTIANKANEQVQEVIAMLPNDYVGNEAFEDLEDRVTYLEEHGVGGGDASGQIAQHNTSTTAHSDIRLLISNLTNRLNALANSDDTTLDQMAEVVAYIKDNRELIEQVTTGKVSVSDIINNLTTNVSNKPLSAAQGVVLKSLIDSLTTSLEELVGVVEIVSETPIPYPITTGCVELQPEKYYAFGEVSSLNLTLVEPEDDKAHEFYFEFIPTEDFSGLTITPEPQWVAEPHFAPGKTCQVSILRGMAVSGCA